MAKKTKTPERDSLDIAQELLEIRQLKNKLIAQDKSLTDMLKARLKEGDEGQDLFELQHSPTLSITDPKLALAWAQKNYPHIVTVDMKSARAILQREFKLPEGFEVIENYRLVVTGVAEEE